MKKVKDLLNKIAGLEGKKKRIILVSSTAVVGVAVLAGIAMTYNSNTGEDVVVSRTEVEESNKGDKPAELTDEKKEYNVKVTSYLDAIQRLKEFGVEYGDGVTPSEKEIDKALEDVYAAIKVEEDKKLAKHEEEEKKKEEENKSESTETPSTPQEEAPSTPSTPQGEAPSQPEAPSTPSAPQETPSEPAPPVETPVAPAPQPEVPQTPAIPSGWKDDVANAIYNTFSTSGVTNTTSFVTQQSLDYVRSRVEGWFNGDGSNINGINADSLANAPVNGAMYLKLYTLTSFTVQGLNVDNIINTTANYVMSPGQVDFCWVKVYYDSATDTSTVYFADGALGV